MNSENGWIPWKDRTDLNEYFIIVRYVECNSKIEEIFPFLRKIPEKYLDEIRNDIQDIACKKYYHGWVIESVVVYLYSYKDCSREEKKMILRGQILRKDKERQTQDTQELKYHEGFINEALSIIDICEQLEKEEFDNGVIGVDNGTVPEVESASAPNAGDLPAAPAPVPSDNDSPEDNKTVKPEMTQKKKGGRPTKEQEERICIAIIELFDSPKKSQIINSIKTLGDAVKKINRLLRESGIQIDERRLDGDKKPGRLFRYLWYFHTKIFRWGYREQNLEMDKDLIKEYRTKYKKYQDYLEK